MVLMIRSFGGQSDRLLVDVFGEVWHFMYFNSVTGNDENFKDAHHYSPWIAEVIVRKLFGLETEKIYDDFGMKISAESLGKDIVFLRQNMETKGNSASAEPLLIGLEPTLIRQQIENSHLKMK